MMVEKDGNWDRFITRTVLFFVTIDFFITKKIDIFIHHICIVMFSSFEFLHNANDSPCTSIVTSTLRNTELSSFFLVLLYWIPKDYKLTSAINNCLFILTFIKYRVYDLFIKIIVNKDVYICMNQFTNGMLIRNIHFYGSIYMLYGLNLYWFAIILKKIYKGLFSKYESYELTELILQYSYDLCMPISIYVYFFQTTREQITEFALYYYYDVVFISLLALCSGLYHASSYYSILLNGPTFNCAGEVLWPYILDHLSIRFRTFSVVYCNLMIRSTLGHNTKEVLLISSISNIISAVITIIYLTYLHVNSKKYSYDLSDKESMRHHYILTLLNGFPIFIATFLMTIGLNNILLTTYIWLVLYCILLISFVKPFYKLNHVILHIALIFQTWILCKINTSYMPIKND